jgi:hypothetical protein
MQIALSTTHVYWMSSGSIMRTPKAGGASESVTPSRGRGPFIDGARLYWADYPDILGMPLDGSRQPEVLAHAGALDSWAVHDDSLYFVPDISDAGVAAGSVVVGSSGQLGAAQPLARSNAPFGKLAADATGVYWYEDTRGDAGVGAVIRKYDLATHQVSDFASVSAVQFLIADGTHVLWADVPSYGGDTVVWSNTPDGSRPLQLGRAGLVRQLASDGVSAYWASSAVGAGASDIVKAPLAGGTPRTIACGIENVYSLAVDSTHVYYSTWDANGLLARLPKDGQ